MEEVVESVTREDFINNLETKLKRLKESEMLGITKYNDKIEFISFVTVGRNLNLLSDEEFWHYSNEMDQAKEDAKIKVKITGGTYKGKVGRIHYLDERQARKSIKNNDFGKGSSKYRIYFDGESEPINGNNSGLSRITEKNLSPLGGGQYYEK